MMSSVTSSSSNAGVSRVRLKTVRTVAERVPERTCEGDRLTPTRVGLPATSQARAWRQAVSSTHSATRSEIEDVFTTGMNAPGGTRPRVG